MIHGVRIKNGKVTYVSRFVKTSRLKQEEIYGGSKFVKVCHYVLIHLKLLLSFLIPDMLGISCLTLWPLVIPT